MELTRFTPKSKQERTLVGVLLGLGALGVLGWVFRKEAAVALGLKLSPNVARWEPTVRAALRERGMERDDLVRAYLAILTIESGGRVGVVGDAALQKGPSIGPGQVYRNTARALGLWADLGDADMDGRARYIALGKDPTKGDLLVRWGVTVFLDKLKLAGGDVAQAVRRYNGSGPMAEAYRAKAELIARNSWGVDLSGRSTGSVA